MRKNLQHITIKKSEARNQQSEERNFLTPEGIELKSTYTEQDIENLEHLDFGAGFAPNLRGIHTTTQLQKIGKIHPNTISIDSETTKEPEINVATELAQTLLKGLKIVQSELAKGVEIDTIASEISFSFTIGMNPFLEIAKMRAARMLWAKLMLEFSPKNNQSFELRIHSQTANCNFDKDNFLDNATRNCIEATAAVLGGCQSTPIRFDQNRDSLNDSAIRITKNIPLFLEEETKISQTVDPWGGSFYVESLTHEIAQTTWKRIQEIENSEGITQQQPEKAEPKKRN